MTRLPWTSANPILILNIKTIIVFFCRQLLELLFSSSSLLLLLLLLLSLLLLLFLTIYKITLYFYDGYL